MAEEIKQLPDIILEEEIPNSPVLRSPNSVYELPFYQTRETLINVEDYKRFLDNAISRFRQSRTYKNYKHYLMTLGLDHCHFMSNITSEACNIEMHHNMLTIFDIAVIITEHVINTVGYISTFDLVQLLKYEHTNNRIQIVMLTETAHQLFHANPDFFIHPNNCFGNWVEFLNRYHTGITRDIAYKIINYLKDAEELETSNDNNLLLIRDQMLNWSAENEFLFGGGC